MLFFNTTIDGIQLGLCFAILALGLYISYSILDFPDLSVDGTFPLGGVVGTIFMYRIGIPPIIAIIMSFIVGMLAGLVTGILHVKCKMSKLLAGIIVMTGLLSITLALTSLLTANGAPTVIFGYIQPNQELKTLFNPEQKEAVHILILLAMVIVAKIIIDLFLKTKLGYMIKATGNNESLVISLGKDSGIYKMIGISIANGFVSASGAIYAQYTLSYDNTSGSGKVVLALASVIIGLAIFSNIKFIKDTTAVILGAVIYSLCLNYIVLIDSEGIYTKLLNAVLFAIILIFNNKISALFSKKSKNKSPREYETGEVK